MHCKGKKCCASIFTFAPEREEVEFLALTLTPAIFSSVFNETFLQIETNSASDCDAIFDSCYVHHCTQSKKLDYRFQN